MPRPMQQLAMFRQMPTMVCSSNPCVSVLGSSCTSISLKMYLCNARHLAHAERRGEPAEQFQEVRRTGALHTHAGSSTESPAWAQMFGHSEADQMQMGCLGAACTAAPTARGVPLPPGPRASHCGARHLWEPAAGGSQLLKELKSNLILLLTPLLI